MSTFWAGNEEMNDLPNSEMEKAPVVESSAMENHLLTGGVPRVPTETYGSGTSPGEPPSVKPQAAVGSNNKL